VNKTTINTGFGILVLDRGNVIAGDYEFTDEGQIITVKNGSVVRRWGTTRGLGQIAENGPTDDTKLDPLNRDAFVAKSALVYIVDADRSKWL